MEAQMTAVAPSSTAFVMATVIPRSLNEPVGLAPSYFRKTRQPSSRLSHSARDQRGTALAQGRRGRLRPSRAGSDR